MVNVYNKDTGFLFIHIPKTGGWGIRTELIKFTHKAMCRIPRKWDPVLSVAFVRNPYDRLLSAYNMFKYGCNGPGDVTFPAKPEVELEDVIDILVDDRIPYNGRNHPSIQGKFGGDYECFVRHHILPMTHPANCLDHAKTIYRFENYEESVNKIMSDLSIDGIIPHKNKAEIMSDYRSAITPEMKEKIDKVYKEDLAQFGYEF